MNIFVQSPHTTHQPHHGRAADTTHQTVGPIPVQFSAGFTESNPSFLNDNHEEMYMWGSLLLFTSTRQLPL